MTPVLIVIDSNHPLVRQNRCFEIAHEYTGCGHAIYVRLAREARRRDMEIATADVYLSMNEPSKKVVCITDMNTPLTEKVLAKGAYPLICISTESPLNAKRFFHNIVRYAGRFQHNFQFRGTKDRLLNSGTIFHPIVFQMETNIPLMLKSWKDRDYLILVNSNKRATFHNWNNYRSILRTLLYAIYNLTLKSIDPWMRVHEIYKDRIEAIYHFSKHTDFTLYGLGWDQSISGYGLKYKIAAEKVWAGTLEYKCKREIMGGFKFALCFENCVFPGYVTEKIFDCFLAGCIPIYFGAPDIADFVPEQAFIDYRKFGNYHELDHFMREMTDSEALVYLNAARDFLASPAFDKFTVDYFVNDILNVIQNKFNNKREKIE
jgi:hypothetical protein